MCILRLHRGRLRRTGWAVLVGWVLAFATGWVNACLLAPPVVGGHGTSESVAAKITDAHHGPGHDAGKDSCVKFCGDESTALSKGKATSVDVHVLPVPVAAAWRASMADLGIDTGPSLTRPRVHGPPLVIRFLRLTL